MKKYLLISLSITFLILTFFIAAVGQNTALALTQGAKCYIANGANACGSATLFCKQTNNNLNCGIGGCTGPQEGVCTPKSTSGLCTNSYDCASGYSCVASTNAKDCTTTPLTNQKVCNSYCQKQTVGNGNICQGSGQGNCQPGYTCATGSKGVGQSDCQAMPLTNQLSCNTICQKQQVGNGDVCTGSGQGNCQSGYTCLPGSKGVGQSDCQAMPLTNQLSCNNICQKQQGAKGNACQGSGQSNCKSGLTCVPGSKGVGQSDCQAMPLTNQLSCNNVCGPPGNAGDACSGNGQGTCGSNLLCNPDTSSKKCVNSPLSSQKVCPDTCQHPTSPSSAVSATPIPLVSPPCNAFTNGQCVSFNTALGAIKTNVVSFVTQVFGILIAIAGGVALIIIMIAGYRFMTSQGKPEALQQAREQLIAAIVGLLFVVFSMVILQSIGVDILQIPGLGQ